jgi:hypothetical protein
VLWFGRRLAPCGVFQFGGGLESRAIWLPYDRGVIR